MISNKKPRAKYKRNNFLSFRALVVKFTHISCWQENFLTGSHGYDSYHGYA